MYFKVFYKHQFTKLNEKPIEMRNLNIPFDVDVRVIPSFEFNYMGKDRIFSSCGISLKLKRKSIASLIGSYYAPTGIFAGLSMISFLIHPDMVRTLRIKFRRQYRRY